MKHVLIRDCNYHTRNVDAVRRYLDSSSSVVIIVLSLFLSRVDFCNSLYNNLPGCLLRRLQSVVNKAYHPYSVESCTGFS